MYLSAIGRTDEALPCFERVAEDDEGRIQAMQLFLLTMHLRASSEPSWTARLFLAGRLCRKRRMVTADELVTDVMKFWGGLRMGTPSLPGFVRGGTRFPWGCP